MFYSNTLNLLQVGGGTQVKQGDLGSKFSYKLANEKDQELDDFDKEVAHINLVLDDKIVFTTTATVDNSTVTFNIDKAIPVGLYFLEIKIRDYIFPSDKQTIIFVQSGAVAYDLKELVPNYDVNMTLKGILSDLSQKGIDISDLDRQLAQKANKDEVTNVITPKGTLAYASLPTSGNQVGWYYYCPDGDGTHGAGNYVWNGTSWFFGGTGDEGYNLLKEDINNKIEMIEPVNLFSEKYVVSGKYLRGGNGDKIGEIINDSFNYAIIPITQKTQYIVTGTSFYTYLLDENNVIIERKGSPNGNDKFSFTCEYDNVKYVAINYRPSVYPTETYMLVKGGTLPSKYEPNFEAYYKFKLSQYYATLKDIKDISAIDVKEYHVGENGDYTKFIECLKDLKDNTDNKVIYVDGGTYDIFSEIGGKSFCDTIPEGETDWKKYSVFIPPNTSVVGVGDVFFNFNPSIDEIGNGLKLLSPINIQGTCHLENITINASNCRYCIHDDTEGDTKYIGAKKTYKNVHCSKSGSGLSQAYACGFDDLMVFSFDNCIFESTLDAFSMHNRATNDSTKSSRVTINNCAFIAKDGDNTRYSIRFGNVNWREEQIKVFISNSYMNNTVKIANETDYGVQNFDVTMLMCNRNNIDVVLKEGGNNRFIPKIYN